jgi:ABC-type glycerol-3-phosphate transport system substrate-binding protein
MSWLLQEKPDLAKRTKLYPSPGKNVVDAWCFGVFKHSKFPKEAKACLTYTMQPRRYETFIKALTGRWLPVYKDLAKDPPWNTGIDEHLRAVGHGGPGARRELGAREGCRRGAEETGRDLDKVQGLARRRR